MFTYKLNKFVEAIQTCSKKRAGQPLQHCNWSESCDGLIHCTMQMSLKKCRHAGNELMSFPYQNCSEQMEHSLQRKKIKKLLTRWELSISVRRWIVTSKSLHLYNAKLVSGIYMVIYVHSKLFHYLVTRLPVDLNHHPPRRMNLPSALTI